MTEPINADYVVIGAGAMGMAFVDTILTDSDKTVAIIDRNSKPGGHWTNTYPYVRLHQPAAYYGVNSTPLGSDTIDEKGWNESLYTLASGKEVCQYFERVMKDKFLSSGQVQYLPSHTYSDAGQICSLEMSKVYQVSKNSCIVDATYSQTEIPSSRPPPYEVAQGIDLVAPNGLPGTSDLRSYANYTVVGAGKTGIDACLWLLDNSVDVDQITWIMPRDSYFFEREAFQPGAEFAKKKQTRAEGMGKAIMAASSIEDLLNRQVEGGQMLQLDENVTPTMFHCATISSTEFDALKKIKNLIRKGRVTQITKEHVFLEHDSYKPEERTLYIDCTANAIPKSHSVPVFGANKITLQPIRTCQQTFSAALIAHVEITYDDRSLKNELCLPVPMPDEPVDYALVTLQTNINSINWYRHPKTFEWVRNSRLNMYRDFLPAPPVDQEQYAAFARKLTTGAEQASKKLCELLYESPHRDVARNLYERLFGAHRERL